MADVGGQPHRGANSVEIEVATPLFTRLRISDPTVFGTSARQNCGLVGPFQLTPYVRRTVA